MSIMKLNCGRLEISVDPAEPRYRGHNVVRKHFDARIVMLYGFVVPAAGDRDPILGALERLQQIAVFLAAVKFGVALHHQHQARQSVIQTRIGLDLFLLVMREAKQFTGIVERQDGAGFGGRFGLH